MQVKRINVNAETKFEFNVKATRFIVKNFTSGDIYVCLGNEFDEETSIRIPSMIAEEVFDNFNEDITKYTTKLFDTVTVKADSAGEVEVRCLE